MLRRQLGNRFFPLSEALSELARLTVRASSVIENLNSRLRGYFFLRRHLGPDYLESASILPQSPPLPAE